MFLFLLTFIEISCVDAVIDQVIYFYLPYNKISDFFHYYSFIQLLDFIFLHLSDTISSTIKINCHCHIISDI